MRMKELKEKIVKFLDNHSRISIALLGLGLLLLGLCITSIVNFLLGKQYGLSSEIGDMANYVITVIATCLVFYELRENAKADKKENAIKEGEFILKLNQTFIQDKNMTRVEKLLEDKALRGRIEPIINDENLQMFVNYNVYLEGLAPLVLNEVISLDHIDDLMAYRFFLSMNNDEVQRVELRKYVGYYKGCYKLYNKWALYRLGGNKDNIYDYSQEEIKAKIPFSENSLHKTYEFNEFIKTNAVVIKQLKDADQLKKNQLEDIAELIYHTDPYIYPAMFGEDSGLKNAKVILPDLISSGVDEMFKKSNLFVSIFDKEVVGVILWCENGLKWNSSRLIELATQKGVELNQDNYLKASKEYFDSNYQDSDNGICIINCCIKEKWRGLGYATNLLKSFIKEHDDECINLCVLEENQNAVKLYKKLGFIVIGESNGFSLETEKPRVYEMKREEKEKDILLSDS